MITFPEARWFLCLDLITKLSQAGTPNDFFMQQVGALCPASDTIQDPPVDKEMNEVPWEPRGDNPCR